MTQNTQNGHRFNVEKCRVLEFSSQKDKYSKLLNSEASKLLNIL